MLRRGHTQAEAKQLSNDPDLINEALINYRRIGVRPGETPEERRKISADLVISRKIGEDTTATKKDAGETTTADQEIRFIRVRNGSNIHQFLSLAVKTKEDFWLKILNGDLKDVLTNEQFADLQQRAEAEKQTVAAASQALHS
jgi:hypothetical protein